MASQWFYQIMGQQLGPVSSTELRVLAAAGTIEPDTLVRKGTDGCWVWAEKVQGLFRPNGLQPAPAARLAAKNPPVPPPLPAKQTPIPCAPPATVPREVAAGSDPSTSKVLKPKHSVTLAGMAGIFVGAALGKPVQQLVISVGTGAAVALAAVALVIVIAGIMEMRKTAVALAARAQSERVRRLLISSEANVRAFLTSAATVVLVILVACGLGRYAAVVEQRQQETAVSQFGKQLVNELSSTDVEGLPQRIERLADTAPTGTGEVGEVNRWMKSGIIRASSLMKDCMNELDGIGWGKILDPERLGKKGSLEESVIIIQQAKAIVSKYRALMKSHFDQQRKDIGNLNINISAKNAMLNGFDKTTAVPLLDAQWDLLSQTLAEMEKLFALLSAKKGTLVVRDGQIAFADQRDTAAFNSYLASIQDLERRQAEIQRKGQEHIQKCLRELEK